MAKVTYKDPVDTVSGKLFGKKSNISQRKLFGIYETSYCYQNKPEQWSDAQTLHRQKMGTASLYAKLWLQDAEFAEQVTKQRLEIIQRSNKSYMRNQQLLTSIIYNRLSSDETFAATLLEGYSRYRACPIDNRSTLLAQLTEESAPFKSQVLN